MPADCTPARAGRRWRWPARWLGVGLGTVAMLVGAWWLAGRFSPRPEPLMLQGRPARDYFPHWIARGSNGVGFVSPPSLNLNNLTGPDIRTLIRLAGTPAPDSLDLVLRIWPSLPASVVGRLPLPQPPAATESQLFGILGMVLESNPGPRAWVIQHFETFPQDFQPALLRRLAREHQAIGPLTSWAERAATSFRSDTPGLASLFERHLGSADPRTRVDAALGLIRLPGTRPGEDARCLDGLRAVVASSEVDPAAWNRIGLALLGNPARAAAFRPVLEALATNPVVDEMAGIPLARWLGSDPRPPLSAFCHPFLDRHGPVAGRFLVLSLHSARPAIVLDAGMLPVLSRLIAYTNLLSPVWGRYSDATPAVTAAERLRQELGRGFTLQFGEPEYAVRLLEHLDVPKADIARALVPMLRHPGQGVRRGAAALLEKLGPDVGLDPVELRGMLGDPEIFHPLVRWLGSCGPRASALVPDLMPRFKDPDRVIRELVATQCRQIAPTDPRLLAAWVESLGDPAVQPLAVSALAAYGAQVPPSAVAALGAMVTDEGAGRGLTELRIAAARTLGALGANALPVVPQLESASRSPVEAVRTEAQRSLGRIRAE